MAKTKSIHSSRKGALLLFVIFFSISVNSLVQAQVSKTVNVSAGGLRNVLTEAEKATVTNLTITGTINKSDFETLNDEMPLLSMLDLSKVKVIDPINEIPPMAFNENYNLKAIVLPSTITKIGNYAFEYCEKLEIINIPNSVIEIGDGAFSDCYLVTSLTIPASVTSIGDYAFSECYGLITVSEQNPNYSSRDGVLFNKAQSLLYHCPTALTGKYVIPNTVETIVDDAFDSCDKLTEVIIPSSVTSIEQEAFYNCSGLVSVTIPSSIVSIEESTFKYCNSLVSVIIPSTVTSIGDEAFYYCESLTSIIFSPSVTSIGEEAFYYCTGLSSVTIPGSIKTIGENAFYGCTCNINIESNNPTYSSVDGVLYNKSQTQLIKCSASKSGGFIIPGTVTSIEANAFSECTGLTSVTIPSSVSAIGDWAFSNCTSLKQIAIPSLVTQINWCAFSGCIGLETITIPSSVSRIEGGAFSDCSSLKSITIPSKVTLIEDRTFSGCSALSSVNFSSSLTEIGWYAFEDCSSLSLIEIPSTVNTIGVGAFQGCKTCKSVTIPSSVISIEMGAFRECGGLITVAPGNPNYMSNEGILFNKNQSTLIQFPISKTGRYVVPSSVTTIGEWAFAGAQQLSSIIIPSSVNSIIDYAFMGCSGLISVSPENVKFSSQDGVLFCKDKTVLIYCPTSKSGDLTLPTSLAEIGDYSLYNCDKLTSINIPSLVTSLGWGVFSGCKGLVSIYSYPILPPTSSIYEPAFYDVNTLNCILYVPHGTKKNYQIARDWKDFENIVEMEVTGQIDLEKSVESKIYSSGQTIRISSPENHDPTRITIYDLNGRLISSRITNEAEISLPISQGGAYLVRVENGFRIQTEKVIIQ